MIRLLFRRGAVNPTLKSAGAASLVVLSVGMAMSASNRFGGATAGSHVPSPSATDDELVASLKSYVRGIGDELGPTEQQTQAQLPDVDTMTERLAARLAAEPDNLDGWRMLGWSYFQTARYDQSAAALAKAVALDPTSEDLKRAYEDAKARVTAGR